jgi:hydroxypyruvate reductase
MKRGNHRPPPLPFARSKDNRHVPDLKAIYLDALAACAPARITQNHASSDLPRNVIALGKCAGAMYDGFAAGAPVDRALVIVPSGYPAPATNVEVLHGGHPHMTSESFDAGRRLIEFADSIDDAVVLISGGSSACVESPLEPWFTMADLSHVNAQLLAAGVSIAEMNLVRRRLSAIKGGRLAQRIGGRVVTLILSDVATGQLHDVGSGPTLVDPSTDSDAIAILTKIGTCESQIERMSAPDFPSPPRALSNIETRLLADNTTLVESAARAAGGHGLKVTTIDTQLESDVQAAAELLVDRALAMEPGSLLAAGGDVTVRIASHGGRGGRCTELAVRFAIEARRRGMVSIQALFGSSDGVDGNSPASAILLHGISGTLPDEVLLDAIRRSDTFSAAERLGETVMIPPTGNNLRDLVLLARG